MKTFCLFLNKKSEALLSAIIIIVVVLALGAGLIFHVRSHANFTELQTKSNSAFTLAKSGIEIAEKNIGSGNIPEKTYTLGPGSVTIKATSGAITSVGKVEESTQVLTKTVPVSATPPVTTWAKAYSVTGQTATKGLFIEKASNGKFWLVGDIDNGTGDKDFLMFKLGADGNPDTTFGTTNGIMTFGGDNTNSDKLDEMARGFCETPDAADGGFIIGGPSDTFSTSGGGGSKKDFLVLKISNSQAKTWEMVYRHSKDDVVRDIDESYNGSTLDGFIVTGSSPSWTGSQSAGVLFKVNPSTGNPVVDGSFGTTGIRHYTLTNTVVFRVLRKTSVAGYVVGGNVSENVPGTQYDFLIVKVNQNGTKDWARMYGPQNSYDYLMNLIPTSDGGYLAVGWTEFDGGGAANAKGLVIKTLSDGTVSWAKTYDENTFANTCDRIYSVQETSDGYIFGGYSQFPSANGSQEMLLIKTDFNGVKQWAKLYGSTTVSSNEELDYLDQASDGGYILSGFSSVWGGGSFNALVIKVDGTGSVGCSDQPTSPDLSVRNASITGDQTNRASEFPNSGLLAITDTSVSFNTVADPNATVRNPAYTVNSICVTN